MEICGLKFVTDREVGITKALQSSLPNVSLYYCWNHILRDVEYWVKKKKHGEDSDEDIYKNNVWDLLDSESEEHFLLKYENISDTWTKEFAKYFDSYLKDDIMTSGKWILNSPEVNIYKERTGITNNPSESFNSVLKRLFTKEVKAQVCILSMYELYQYYNKEIVQGYSKLGDYKLKTYYVDDLYVNPMNAEYPKSSIDLKDIPYCFMNKDMRSKQLEGDEEEYSTFSLAKRLILQNRIVHVPQLQCFIVKGEKEEYLVKLNGNKKDSCTCKLKTNCHHIEAVKYSINHMDVMQNNVKLHTLERKRRGYTAGRKKLPKNVTILEAADDSELFSQSKKDLTKICMIPTVTPTSNSVKKRFVQCMSTKNDDEEIEVTPKNMNLYNEQSTPKKNGSNKLSSIKLDLFERSIEFSPIENPLKYSEVTGSKKKLNLSTKRTKLDRAYNVCGVQVHENNLAPLSKTIMDGYNDIDLYMYGSTICAYLSILCHERIGTEVTMYTCEDIIVSHNDENELQMLKTGLREFLCRKVPDNDVVFFPVCKNSHCYVIVVLTKLYTVLYLDSLGLVKRKDLSFVMKIFKLYANFNDQEFDENRYSYYAPGVYRQTNGYDCGAYACMFGEAIILGDNSSYTIPINGNLEEYRMHIKDKIIEYMHKNSTLPNEYDFDKLKFKKFLFKCTINIQESVSKEIPFRGDAMTYLGQIASTYWQSVECSVCEKKNTSDNSHNITKQWVYCKNGNHWLHWSCVGINATKELPIDSYTCPRCEDEQFSE